MLHCAVYDTSPQTELSVKWEKENGALSAGVHQLANGSLFFSSLIEENLGGYICSARKGSKQIRSSLTVSKAYLENVFFSPQSQNVNKNQDVFFQCVSGDSAPPAHILWLKNSHTFTRGTQIQGQYGGGSQKKTSGTLHLTNVSKSDQGHYVCVTHNPLLNISKESGTATLKVSVISTVGAEVIIQCQVSGHPVPSIDWLKRGQSVKTGGKISKGVRNATLYISSVRNYDEGFYTCAASNSVGQDEKTTTLQVADTYLKNSPTDFTPWVPTPFSSYISVSDHDSMNKEEKGKYKDLLKTPGPQSVFPYSKLLETRTQKRHALVTPANLITQHPDDPMLHWSHMKPLSLSSPSQTFKHILLQGPPDQHTSSQEAHASTSSLAQAHEITQTSGFTLYNKNSITSTTPMKVHQYWSQPAEQFTATKASQANNTELVEMLNKNTSKAPMRTTDDNARAFEDDNMAAVIEQSPNTSEIRAHPPTSSPSTLLMESCYGDTQEEGQPSQDMPVIVETHPEPCEEEQLETSFEEGKVTPILPSDIQLQCTEDWKSHDLGQCQRDAPSPPPSNPVGTQEEGLRSSLTLQTGDSSTTPVHHSISLSHASCPLMLSHCVTLGLTSVAVDVHFYPSTTTQYGPLRPQSNSRHEHDQSALSKHHSK
ncbi:roundabout-like 1-like [Silurus meridionalis]|nr:roundabout-like 1-like [Silurus meridionalis]